MYLVLQQAAQLHSVFHLQVGTIKLFAGAKPLLQMLRTGQPGVALLLLTSQSFKLIPPSSRNVYGDIITSYHGANITGKRLYFVHFSLAHQWQSTASSYEL
jgi:hypothetical protein